MRTSLSRADLAAYVGRQAEAFFPEGPIDREHLGRAVEHALERLRHCFERIGAKYYRDEDGEPVYDPLHTDQHAAFLYLLSNELWRDAQNPRAAARIYALNKALHALDVFYEVELPSVFLFQHPVGTVLGRATYSDFLAVYQGVTVGSGLDGTYPELGEGVVLFGGARVIGRARIGANSWVAPGAIVMDREFPPGSVLFGVPPATERRPTRRDVRRDLFRVPTRDAPREDPS